MSDTSVPRTRTSVLIPSLGRPERLAACLESLAAQTRQPDEVLVVWQGDDAPTREKATAMAASATLPFPLRVLHSPATGVVPAENVALDASVGEVVLLIDDDALAPPAWVERHLSFYSDPAVGVVGGPADNFRPDRTRFPTRSVEPLGRLRWFGRMLGNMYDQPVSWRTRSPRDVDHLVGFNMSLRRCAFDRFEVSLRPYWQLFELDACLQARCKGYRVIFDFGNVVEHYPTNTAYVGGRNGDLQVKVLNAAYNHGFVLAKHAPRHLRPWQWAYQLAVGSVSCPGMAASLVGMWRYGRPLNEMRILLRTLKSWANGARDGAKRRLTRSPHTPAVSAHT